MKPVTNRPVVVKLGTGVVTDGATGLVDRAQIQALADEIAEIRSTDQKVILVSSGAVGAGLEALGLTVRPTEISLLQACAAVGQTRLMQVYQECFATENLLPAQLLLTRANFVHKDQKQRVLATLATLLEQESTIPVINENDSVAVEELAFGDNDMLGAELAALVEAQEYILLTGVEGLLDQDAKDGPTLIKVVEDIDAALPLVGAEKGELSVGGMGSKLEAIRRAVDSGVPAIIANGRNLAQLSDLVSGGGVCTRFPLPHSEAGDPA